MLLKFIRIVQSCKTKSYRCQILLKLVDFFNGFRQKGASDCQSDNIRTHEALIVRLGQERKMPIDFSLFIGISGSGYLFEGCVLFFFCLCYDITILLSNIKQVYGDDTGTVRGGVA